MWFWFTLIQAGGQRGISTLREVVSYTTLWCGGLPSHCGLLIIAGSNAVRLDKTAALLQHMMDMFLIRLSAHFLQSPEGRQSKSKQIHLSFQKIWPETISLSSCTNLNIYSNLPVEIPSDPCPPPLEQELVIDCPRLVQDESNGSCWKEQVYRLQVASSSEIRDVVFLSGGVAYFTTGDQSRSGTIWWAWQHSL